jgi:glucokinase
MLAFPIVLGDIGGTNARFGVLAAPGEPIRFLPRTLTASAPDPVEAVRGALLHYEGPAPRSAMIAVACRVDSTIIRMTNAPWIVDAQAIARAFALERVVLVNDYTPVAASAAALDRVNGDIAPIGPMAEAGHGTRVVFGPGTGLGVGALMPVENRFVIVSSEAGHVEFGPASEEEMAIWPFIERVGGRVSAEVVLSGPGLLRLARAVSASRGQPCACATPKEVVAGAIKGDPLCTDVAALFARCLGRYAGDLALTFEATGGVFIAGGIAPRMLDIIRGSAFRRAFEHKGPHEEWAKHVPVFVVTHPEPALLGLAAIVTRPESFIFHREAWP